VLSFAAARDISKYLSTQENEAKEVQPSQMTMMMPEQMEAFGNNYKWSMPNPVGMNPWQMPMDPTNMMQMQMMMMMMANNNPSMNMGYPNYYQDYTQEIPPTSNCPCTSMCSRPWYENVIIFIKNCFNYFI
jgi:hypothetical protein